MQTHQPRAVVDAEAAAARQQRAATALTQQLTLQAIHFERRTTRVEAALHNAGLAPEQLAQSPNMGKQSPSGNNANHHCHRRVRDAIADLADAADVLELPGEDTSNAAYLTAIAQLTLREGCTEEASTAVSHDVVSTHAATASARRAVDALQRAVAALEDPTRWGGLYKLDGQFRPIHSLKRLLSSTLAPELKCDLPVSSLCAFKRNLCRYTAAGEHAYANARRAHGYRHVFESQGGAVPSGD
jgi:hypothetical protein